MEKHGLWAVIGIAAVGCAVQRSTPVVGPASEAEHRALASQHAQKARAEQARYDPRATVQRPIGPAPIDDAAVIPMEREENPTDKHLRRARRERALAEAHANAARKIEAFQDAECAASPAAERAACPLITDARAEDIPGGVRIHVAGDAAGTLARVRCHLAFAREGNYAGQDECPLYVPGTHAQPAGEGGLDVTTDMPENVAELRRRVREHVTP